MYNEDKYNPFGESTDDQSLDEALFGTVDVPDSGRVIAKPVKLDEIWADLEQPRRLIPIEVRRYVGWKGEPSQFKEMLEAWLLFASDEYKARIDPVKAIMAHESQDLNANTGNALVDRYVRLLELAASIRKDGLANPITIYKRSPSGYLVETGERRLLAHHLLRLYLGDWQKIPATVKDKNIWLQAFENNQRQDLSGVSMARQFALLLMDMYAGDPHVEFDSMSALVLPGEPDQAFYAQVEHGERYKIKHGRSQEVKKALGVRASRMLSHLRDILRMDADLWVRADEADWSVNRIIEEIDKAEGTNKSGQFTEKTSETYTDRYTFEENQPHARENVTRVSHSDPPTPPVNKPEFGRQELPTRPVEHGGGVREWASVPASPRNNPTLDPSPKAGREDYEPARTSLEGASPEVVDGNDRLLRQINTWRETESLIWALGELGREVDNTELAHQLGRVKTMTPSKLAEFENVDELNEWLQSIDEHIESVVEAHWQMYYSYTEMLVAELAEIKKQ